MLFCLYSSSVPFWLPLHHSLVHTETPVHSVRSPQLWGCSVKKDHVSWGAEPAAGETPPGGHGKRWADLWLGGGTRSDTCLHKWSPTWASKWLQLTKLRCGVLNSQHLFSFLIYLLWAISIILVWLSSAVGVVWKYWPLLWRGYWEFVFNLKFDQLCFKFIYSESTSDLNSC